MNFQKHLACLLILLCIMSAPVRAMVADSIAFYKTETWANLLGIAQKEKKIIFIDVYTAWCGPCKAMDKKTFKEAEVAQYFNQTFVNVKLDAEKGEGVELSKKYKVNSFPSYLFVNEKGELLATFGGFMKAEAFLKKTKETLKTIQTLASLEQAYQAGKREPEFLATYTLALKEAGKSFVDTFDQYWQARNKPTEPTEKDLNLAYQLINDRQRGLIDYESALMQTCLQNREALYKLHEEDSVKDAIKDILKDNVRHYTRQKDEKRFEEILKILEAQETKKNGFKYEEQQYRLDFYKQSEQWERYFPVAIETNKGYEKQYSLKSIASMDSMTKNIMKYMKENKMADVLEDLDLKEISMKGHAVRTLTEFAWDFHDHTENPAYLQEALKWSAHALMLEENTETLTIQAHLLAKNNQRKEASKLAKKATNVAEKEMASAKDEEDKKDIQEIKAKADTLLKKLKQKK